jgi:tRNA nucleotidyltransferase/poly(A) polymerase
VLATRLAAYEIFTAAAAPTTCPALQVNEYLAAQGKDTHSAAVIQSNPDQSKHLETARLKINGVWIDLVNLRSETYADGSRIPTMEFGTPVQDAERRYAAPPGPCCAVG